MIVVGSGGFAAEIIGYLRDCRSASPNGEPILAGVVDDYAADPAPANVCGLPFLGRLDDVPDPAGCRFVAASGTPRFRKETIEIIRARGWALHSVVHPTAIIARDAYVGEGTVIAPYAIVNARARVGVGCALNVFCSVGHDASVGDYSVLSPYTALNGWSAIGELCFLGTRATVFPRVRVGARSMVDTHSFVRADTDERMIVSNRGEYRVLKNRLER